VFQFAQVPHGAQFKIRKCTVVQRLKIGLSGFRGPGFRPDSKTAGIVGATGHLTTIFMVFA
jgi:hypothetical protein